MAIDCLLIDTLQSFYGGYVESKTTSDPKVCPKCRTSIRGNFPSTASIFLEFLEKSKHFHDSFSRRAIRGSFYKNVRSAILHNGETRGKWFIKKNEPADKIIALENNKRVINRSLFHKALKKEFEDYVNRLKDKNEQDLRKNFIKKMNAICQIPSEE